MFRKQTLSFAVLGTALAFGFVQAQQAKPKIPEAQARAVALARVPGGRVKSEELEREGGRQVYSYDIAVEGKSGIEEILVDANTGAVVSAKHETAADEAQEAKEDAKAKADEKGEAEEKAEADEKPRTDQNAKLSEQQARAIAADRVPGGSVKASELEHEKGRLIYSFEFTVAGRDGIEEINVDAMSGQIVSAEHEAK